jgi:hypothetical protein
MSLAAVTMGNYTEAAAPLAAWHFVNFGTNASVAAVARNEADPDGNGLLNIEEYAFNTDPLAWNACPVNALLVATNGQSYLAV